MADSSPPFQDGGELGQTKCKLSDPLASCHEDSSNQGPALLEDLQERGPMPSKGLSEQGPMLSEDLSEQWEQALSNNALKRDLTLPLQTPIISAVPSISPQLRPDHLVPLDISSSQPSEVASCDSETKSAVNEDAQINTLVSLQQALEEVSEPLELEPSLTSVSSVKIGISEFNKTNPFSLPETSAKVPDKSSSSTEKSIVIAEAMTEMLADSVAFPAKKEGTVGTALPEKQSELADSEFTTFSAAIAAGEKCSSVVSALTEKSPDETNELTETYEKLLSDISLQSEKILPDDMDPLQKCSVVDVMPSKPCLTLDTVEEPHLLKFSSPSEGELESPLDTREEPASLPIVLFDHPSPLPSVSTDVIFPLPSTKNSSSSVITVDTKLPYSSKQTSETHISTPLMPSLKEKAELTQIGSESSGSQDVQECFNIRSKKQDYVCGTEEGCELNLQADTCISLDEKLESEGASCVNRILDDSSVVNSEQEMQVDEPGECWNDVDSSREESAMETMPLIVDTHTLSQDDDEHSTVISNNAVNSHLMSSSVLSSPQSSVSNVCTMPLLGTEPLQPVTIGSSLQPLEEVQEASVLDDPSFAADLTLIDSSADEADSIGGLVINSVIGAADGVVDFHPDEEMETDRELTDISASAPQIVEDVCDNDSNDDNGPSAKRMRFENGVSDLDNKAQGTKKVIIRVTPVKNGHGLWDSHKLQEVLLAKGTILLRLHASTDVLEMFETDKDEKEVDFTGIMADSKDEEHDHILGLANLEPDADVFDPLAIVSTHSVDHASPPHYSRPFPHNRGRSTALQPAMSRPGFRHLQSPPHPHYYMKHEVLGLPPPLEFEEPQLGTTDWSGVAHNSMVSYELQNLLDSPTVAPVPFLEQNLQQPQERVKEAMHVLKVVKVCEECGKTFDRSSTYLQHLMLHKNQWQCEKCTFKTKDSERFKLHMISHDKDHFKLRCNICHELFSSPISHRVHKRKIHNIFECKQCSADFASETDWREHRKNCHNKQIRIEGNSDRKKKSELLAFQNHAQASSDKMALVCRLCNKETRNKYQLKLHVAQHLGVSSDKISDDELIADVKPFSWEGQLLSSARKSQEHSDKTVETRKSLALVFPNLLSNINCSLAEPQIDKPTAADLLSSRSQVSDVQPEGEETVSTASISSAGNVETDSLLSVFLPESVCEKTLVKTEINENIVQMPQNILPDNKKVKVKSFRRLRPLLHCKHCSLAFTTHTALRLHKKQKHMKKFQCPECNLTKTNNRKVFQHQIKSHKNKLRCHYFCLALFDTREELSAHHLAVHKKDDSKHPCRHCKKKYPKGTYLKHLEECKESKEIPANVENNSCNFGESKFYTDYEFTDHIKQCTSYKTNNKESKTCIKSFVTQTSTRAETDMPNEIINRNTTQGPNKIETRKHENIDTGSLEKPIEEKDLCTTPVNQENTTPKLQILHLDAGNYSSEGMSEAGGILQKCKFCTSTFDNSEDGVNHVISHHKTLLSYMTREPQVCHICNKSFVSSLSFCKHILNHYGDLGSWDSLVPSELNMENIRVNCWICKTSGMKYHRYHVNTRDKTIEKLLSSKACKMSKSETEKSYNCSVCEESFPCRYSFWNHIKVHLSKSPFKNAEGGKHFKCVKCPMRFKKKTELLGHLGAHLIVSNINEDKGELKTSNDEDSKSEPENKTKTEDKDGDRLEKHQNPNNVSAETVSNANAHPHKCKRCQRKFAKKEDALKHVLAAHKSMLKMMGETNVCHICDKTFMKPMILCNHLLKHYSDLGMWDELVPKNLLEQTKDRRYCWICKNMLGRKASRHINKRNNYIERALSSKIKDLEDEDDFDCSLCDYSCSSRYTYWKHLMLHMYKVPKRHKQMVAPAESFNNSKDFKKEILECSECLRKFEEKSELNKHLATHFLLPFVQVDGKWKSDISQRKNSLTENYANSKQGSGCDEKNKEREVELQITSPLKKAKSDSMKCIRCLKTFESNEEAVSHVLSTHKFMLTRIVREPLTCNMCGTVFQSEWCLCKHVSKHYSDLGMWNSLVPRDLLSKINVRNQCWVCNCKLDKKYADHTSKRNQHIEKLLLTKCKKKEDIFNCSLCNETYQNRLEYWKHTKIHLCKPPVQYRSLNELLTTTSNNTGNVEKLLECSDCSLSFKDEYGLYQHLASHFLEPVSEGGTSTSEDEISETDVSDDDEWLPSSERRRCRQGNRDDNSKIEEGSLLGKKASETVITEDRNSRFKKDESHSSNKLGDDDADYEQEGGSHDIQEAIDDEQEDTYDEFEVGVDNALGIGADDNFEIGTDDEFEIGTDNEFEIGTDDENENHTVLESLK